MVPICVYVFGCSTSLTLNHKTIKPMKPQEPWPDNQECKFCPSRHLNRFGHSGLCPRVLWGSTSVIERLFWDNGKSNGNYYLGLYGFDGSM